MVTIVLIVNVKLTSAKIYKILLFCIVAKYRKVLSKYKIEELVIEIEYEKVGLV